MDVDLRRPSLAEVFARRPDDHGLGPGRRPPRRPALAADGRPHRHPQPRLPPHRRHRGRPDRGPRHARAAAAAASACRGPLRPRDPRRPGGARPGRLPDARPDRRRGACWSSAPGSHEHAAAPAGARRCSSSRSRARGRRLQRAVPTTSRTGRATAPTGLRPRRGRRPGPAGSSPVAWMPPGRARRLAAGRLAPGLSRRCILERSATTPEDDRSHLDSGIGEPPDRHHAGLRRGGLVGPADDRRTDVSARDRLPCRGSALGGEDADPEESADLAGPLALALAAAWLSPLPPWVAEQLSPRSREAYALGFLPGVRAADPGLTLPESAGGGSPVTLDRSGTLQWLAGATACLALF